MFRINDIMVKNTVCSRILCSFYPWSLEVEPWVNRWTFSPSPPSPSPHHQLWGLGGTVLYCTVLYCTVIYCTVQYRTVKKNIPPPQKKSPPQKKITPPKQNHPPPPKKKKKSKIKGGLNCTVDRGSCAADALLFHLQSLKCHNKNHNIILFKTCCLVVFVE